MTRLNTYPLVHNRRQFLQTSATAIGGMALTGFALGPRYLLAESFGRQTPAHVLPNAVAAESLRSLAQTALEEAVARGASYADVRIAYRHQYSLKSDMEYFPRGAKLDVAFEGGIRTLVNGAFAFDYVNVPTVVAFQAAARNAVAHARGFATLSTQPVELARASVVQGDWETPHAIDPFAVPFVEQANLMGALAQAVNERVASAEGVNSIGWERETRVCATTEGTVTTQTFFRVHSNCGARVKGLGDYSVSMIPFGRAGGYELLIGADVQERLKVMAEQALPYTRYPTHTMDVGRYPVVFAGTATASIINNTLAPALQLDRVLGMDANASGTSFLAPPERTLGVPMFSPQLQLNAGRSAEWWTGVQWDDEGVAPATIPLVQHGQVVDYLTDRQTAPTMRAWYAKRNLPLASNGACYVETADRPPTVGGAHLMMTPASATATQDDLIRDISHGVLVYGNPWAESDHQLTSALIGGSMFEVQRGKIVAFVRGAGLQIRTLPFFKNIAAIGDARTVSVAMQPSLRKGEPTQGVRASASAPAILCPAVDLINLEG